MCGRFTLQITAEMLAEIFGLPETLSVTTRYNIAPTQQILVVRQGPDASNHLSPLLWGLIPPRSKDKSFASHMINARSETVHEKPAFRQAIRYRRCIIPSSGFYEWKHDGKNKYPYFVQMKNGSPMCFAGIWDQWKSPEGELVESCSMLTTTSNKLIAPLHERMPVILHHDEYALWLNRNMHDHEQLTRLYQPYPADLLDMYPVSQAVNSPRNDSPDLILPLRD